MTNAEKYQEVFGFPPDRGNCPTEDCKFCPANPCADKGFSDCAFDWWDEEYKGTEVKNE